MMRTSFRLSILSIFMTLLLGCDSIGEFRISCPVASSEYKIFKASYVEIEKHNMKIYVRPANNVLKSKRVTLFPGVHTSNEVVNAFEEMYYSSKVSSEAFFYVEVLLMPNAEGYSFDPLNANLILSDGRTIKGRSFRGPIKDYDAPGPFQIYLLAGEPYLNIDEIKESTQSVEFRLNKRHGVAFTVLFPVGTPDPSKSFKIQLGGLKFDGKTVDLPTVYYSGEQKFISSY